MKKSWFLAQSAPLNRQLCATHGWRGQLLADGTKKPLIVSHNKCPCSASFISDWERERDCVRQWINPQLCPGRFGKLTVQIERSRWGPIWHDYRPARHLVKQSVENHNVSMKGQTVGGSPQCATRLSHVVSRLRHWYSKHIDTVNTSNHTHTHTHPRHFWLM